MAFKLGNESRGKSGGDKNTFNKDEVSIPGIEIIRKDLEPGIQAEANDDGSIFVSNEVEAGSKEERKILMHEMKHMVDMQTGKLSYTDENVTWDGKDYKRDHGFIMFEKEWYAEGDTSLPWEKH